MLKSQNEHSMKPNWKRLFGEARALLNDEADKHAASCGCRDYDPGVVEGLCPGVERNEAFLKRTEHLVEKVAE